MSSSLPDDFDILESFDYVDRDLDTIYARLQSLVVSVWPNWNTIRASWDNYLLALFAHVGDILNYYRDNRLRESFLLTAILRESVIRIGALVGYELHGPVPATATELFTLVNGTTPGDVTIPEGSLILTKRLGGQSQQRWQVSADVVIPSGSTTGLGSVEHTTTRTEFKTSTGLQDQEFTMGHVDYIDGTMEITAANGVYSEVDDFLSTGPTDRHFTLITDVDGRAVVRFGDGNNGEIPVGTIDFIYKTGGGEVGEVEIGTITELQGSFFDSLGNPVTLSATNTTNASGGTDRETIAEAKRNIPAWQGNRRNTVSWQDFQNNSQIVPGVGRAVIMTADQDASVPENTGYLYVAAVGTPYSTGFRPPVAPSASLLDDVETMITETRPDTITFTPFFLPVVFEDIDHVCTIYFEEGVDPSDVASQIESDLKDWYSVMDSSGAFQENARFGFEYTNSEGTVTGQFPWSSVFNVIRDVEGVLKMNPTNGLYLNGLAADVILGSIKLPRFNSLAIVDGDTGLPVSW